ncbi:stage VI sporulation protein F [Marinicrinis lubricantis]|uniref:Stage VI sporulation protein F n=1 Tax=Marinicrinis lubricantis TaxID=2086470 RepID=A0ABW1IMM1_9BACL
MPAAYEKYGISKELVQTVKKKMKDPVIKQKVTDLVENVSKQQLQNPAAVKTLLARISKIMNLSLTPQQSQGIVQFVIDQKIDPNNTFHLLKLWGMFR